MSRCRRWTLRGAVVLGLASYLGVPTPACAQGGTVVVVVRDSLSNDLINGVSVELRSGAARMSARTNEAGLARFVRVPVGSFEILAKRIGSPPQSATGAVNDAATVLVQLKFGARRLPAMAVRERVTAIQGLVASANTLEPIPGVEVEVGGQRGTSVTDSAGRFFSLIDRPGVTFIRMKRRGYETEAFSLDVAKDSVHLVERMMDTTTKTSENFADIAWREFSARRRWTSTRSALVQGEELRARSGSLLDALQDAPSVHAKGLRVDPRACVFVNGFPMRDWPVSAFNVDDVELVETYREKDDLTETLEKRWLSGVAMRTCGRRGRATDPVADQDVVKYIVIWTRKSSGEPRRPERDDHNENR